MPLTRILFPVDFSPNCEKAAQFAQFFASHFGSEIVLLHVMPPAEQFIGLLDPEVGVTDGVRRTWTDRHHERLEQFLADQFPTAQRILLEGEPGTVICECADRQKANMILMPTHGFSLMRRFVLGSVTARVLHHAHCPVFTGLPDATFHGIRTLLCAIDLREQTETTLRYAASMAAVIGSRLVVVHASPTVTTPAVAALDGDLTERLAHEARERIGELLHRLDITASHLCVHPGEAAEVIRHAALQHRADLLVLGRGAVAGGLGRLRAHSYGIINEAPCPVVSV